MSAAFTDVLLSHRTRSVGGRLRRLIREDPPGALAAVQDVLILVHGYNSGLYKAFSSYLEFCRQLEAAGPWLGPRLIARYFWPGDWSVLSNASYPRKTRVATQAGRALAEFLLDIRRTSGRPLRVSVIAHSLGCRLVAEMMAALSQPGPGEAIPRTNWVVDIVFMAAAVPIELVDRGGHLRAALEGPARCAVLHSDMDTILGRAFPLGEFAFNTWRRRRPWPEAVGLFGRPVADSGVPTSASEECTSLEHGEYWRGTGTDPGKAVPVAATFVSERWRPQRLARLKALALREQRLAEHRLPCRRAGTLPW